MRLFLLLTLCSSALGAVYQQCYPFEQPYAGKYKPELKISSNKQDTSLLVYYTSVLQHSNIPPLLNQQTLQQEVNGFKLCSQKLFSTGGCEKVGEFVIKYNDKKAVEGKVANQLLQTGEDFSFEVKEEGIVCVVAYQEGVERVSGLPIKEYHSYGLAPLTQYVISKNVDISFFLTLILSVVFCYRIKIRELNIKRLAVPESFSLLFILYTIELLLRSVKYHALNRDSFGVTEYRLLANFERLGSFLAYYYLLYQFSMNKSVFEKIEGPFSKYYLYACALFAGSGTYFLFESVWLHNSFFLRVGNLLESITAMVPIGLTVILWKNFNSTVSNSTDNTFGKRLNTTKWMLFTTTLGLAFLSFGFTMLFILWDITSTGLDAETADFTGKLTELAQNNIVKLDSRLYLSQLAQYAEPAIILLLSYTWRPDIIQPYRDIQLPNIELPNIEIDLEKNAKNH